MPNDNRTETGRDTGPRGRPRTRTPPGDSRLPCAVVNYRRPIRVALERELEFAERFEQDKETPHLLNFENPSDLRKLLTERRLEVLRSINADPPESIRALADRLDRAASDVHEDVHLLAEYNIVYFEQDGRARAPYIPYDRVEYTDSRTCIGCRQSDIQCQSATSRRGNHNDSGIER